MTTRGHDICLELANAEIAAHHQLMAPAKEHIIASNPTAAQQAFYGPNERNAFWFTRQDLEIFLDAMNTGTINAVVVVLGAHPNPATAPVCPDVPVPPGNFAEGSQTVVLAGAREIPVRDARGLLSTTTSAPYRQYPTQGYVDQLR